MGQSAGEKGMRISEHLGWYWYCPICNRLVYAKDKWRHRKKANRYRWGDHNVSRGKRNVWIKRSSTNATK